MGSGQDGTRIYRTQERALNNGSQVLSDYLSVLLNFPSACVVADIADIPPFPLSSFACPCTSSSSFSYVINTAN